MFGPMRAKIKDEKTGKWRWMDLASLPKYSAMFGPPPILSGLGSEQILRLLNEPRKCEPALDRRTLLKVWTSGEKEMVRK